MRCTNLQFVRLIAAWPLVLYGCAGDGDSAPNDDFNQPAILAADTSRSAESRTVAILDGRPLRQSELMPLLLEIGGLQALTESVLDRRIEAEAERRGIIIGEDDIAREELLLESALDTDADSAARLVDSLRSSRGLGPVRYAALLRRNALLRAVVAPEVVVTEADIAAQFDVLHGERRQPRIITVPKLAEAVEVIRRLADGAPFTDVAVELSTDSSASRGGLLAPISRGDVSYPEPLRSTLWTLLPGDTSSPVMLDGSLAILTCERVIPASGMALDSVRDDVEALARRSRERILMESLAQDLLEGASITILDAELDRQWSGRGD